MPKAVEVNQSTQLPYRKTASNTFLSLTTPKNQDILSGKTITVSGTTTVGAVLVITAGTTTSIVTATPTGFFTKDISVSEGPMMLRTTAVDLSSGTDISDDRLLFVSSQRVKSSQLIMGKLISLNPQAQLLTIQTATTTQEVQTTQTTQFINNSIPILASNLLVGKPIAVVGPTPTSPMRVYQRDDTPSAIAFGTIQSINLTPQGKQIVVQNKPTTVASQIRMQPNTKIVFKDKPTTTAGIRVGSRVVAVGTQGTDSVITPSFIYLAE